MEATVQPAATSAADTQIVPATIDGNLVYIECPKAWCTIDHVRDGQKFLEDVWHSGPFAGLETPRRNGSPGLMAYARLGMDPFSREEAMRRPFIFIEDGNSTEGSYLDAEHAETFADNLVAFAEKIRTMGRALKAVAA